MLSDDFLINTLKFGSSNLLIANFSAPVGSDILLGGMHLIKRGDGVAKKEKSQIRDGELLLKSLPFSIF